MLRTELVNSILDEKQRARTRARARVENLLTLNSFLVGRSWVR
jgi:hypothetical protein